MKPELTQITVTPLSGRVAVEIECDGPRQHGLHISGSCGTYRASIIVRDPDEAREYATALRKAAQELIDWALACEQPHNFTTNIYPELNKVTS